MLKIRRVELAVRTNNVEGLKGLLESYSPSGNDVANCLMEAVSEGRVEVVKVFLSVNYKRHLNTYKDHEKKYPLFIALEKNDVAMARVILNNGMSERTKKLTRWRKLSPMQYVAKFNYTEMAALLLKEGFSPDMRGMYCIFLSENIV